MTKFLAFLVFIMVAVAAFTPCCTGDDCQEERTVASQPGHRETGEQGGCSPFFACTGCTGFTLMEKPVTVPFPAEYHPQYFVADQGYLSTTYAELPWQPPRTT